LSSSFSKGYEVIIHTNEKELQNTYVDSLNRNNVNYGQLPLNNMENPPLDIWFETPESIGLGFDLLSKCYKCHKDKDLKIVLKIVIREPDGKVIEVDDQTQILDIMHRQSY
jgi:hypothetical protein